MSTCRVCSTELPLKRGPGRSKVLCDSLDCRRKDYKVQRGRGDLYLETCLWCRAPLPSQARGEPRKYCEGTSCQKDHLAIRNADYRGRLRQKRPMADLMDEISDSFIVTEGNDKPLSLSPLAHWTTDGWKLDGTCDFNPKMYTAEDGSQPEWLEFFLEEFGARGADPGLTQARKAMYSMDMTNDRRIWLTKGSTES